MANIHIISDLNLGFNEHTNPEDEVIPADCDLLVVNGNVATSPKRSMLFVETLCNKYPDIPVIYNLGMYECGHHDKALGKHNHIDSVLFRQRVSPDWPKNLHFPHLSSVKINIGEKKYDIMCAFGFPKIITGTWEDSFWYKSISFGITEDHSLFRPPGAADVYHGKFPTKSTVEEINQRHDQEEKIIRNWELDFDHDNSGYKILITALSPIQDPFCKGLGYIMYPNFHLYNRLWITSGVKFSGSIVRGAKLFSNPGSGAKARQQLLTI